MEMTEDYTEKQTVQEKVRLELVIKLFEEMKYFKSKTNPDYKLTMVDITNVLSTIIKKVSE